MPFIVLATNTFSKKNVDLLIQKLKNFNLNFYPVKYKSGFTGKESGYDNWIGYYTYDLTFKGKNKEGNLYLITKTEQKLPYKIGQFYKFDLANIRQNGELSGSFIDNNLDKLIFVSCE